MYAVMASLLAVAHGRRLVVHNSSDAFLSSEGHHAKKLFENHRLRILDHYILPGSNFEWRNDWPTVRWQVYENSDMIPTPVFAEAGTVSVISNPRQNRVLRRDYVFEIMKPQPKYTEEQVRALLNDPEWPTDVGSQLFFENRFVRMWDFHSPVGMGSFHLHTLDNAFVVIGAGRALDFYKPSMDHPVARGRYSLQENAHEKVAEISFDGNSDGYVIWAEIEDGGFQWDEGTQSRRPVIPKCLHAVTQPQGRPQFGEYLIELK